MSSIYDQTALIAAYMPRQEPMGHPSEQKGQEADGEDGRVAALPLGYVLAPSEPRGDMRGGRAAGRVYLGERHRKKVYVEAMQRRRLEADNGTLDIPAYHIKTDRQARRKWIEHQSQGRPATGPPETCFDRYTMHAPRMDEKRGAMYFRERRAYE